MIKLPPIENKLLPNINQLQINPSHSAEEYESNHVPADNEEGLKKSINISAAFQSPSKASKIKQRDLESAIKQELALFQKPGEKSRGYILYTENLMERIRKEDSLSQELLYHFESNRPPVWAFSEEKIAIPHEGECDVRVLCVTWNMHGKLPQAFTDRLLNARKIEHHIIVISTQECSRSIPASFFCESKVKWEAHLSNELGKDYTLVRGISMNALHLVAFVHNSLAKHVSAVSVDSKATGIADLIGNKGGIGLSVEIGQKSFLFINSHFASGQLCNSQRNMDYKKISQSLNLPKYYQNSNEDLFKRFHYIFWMGDFNYRIEAQRKEYVYTMMKQRQYFELLKRDQLTGQRRLGEVFSDFQEGLILFPPTYKMLNDSNEYAVGSDSRIPGWTDRIFFKQKLPNTATIHNYEMGLDVFGSDHRPVFAQFEVKLQIQDSFKPVAVKSNSHCNIF